MLFFQSEIVGMVDAVTKLQTQTPIEVDINPLKSNISLVFANS